MKYSLIGLISLIVIASGCTSVLDSSAKEPALSAENNTFTQGSEATVTVSAENVKVIGMADPERLIKSFETSASSPEADRITPNYNTEDRQAMNESSRIGWTVQYSKPVNSTIELPVNSSKDPGVYRYSLIGVNSGQTTSREMRITITG